MKISIIKCTRGSSKNSVMGDWFPSDKTPWPIDIKFCFFDYAGEIINGSKTIIIDWLGSAPQMGEIYTGIIFHAYMNFSRTVPQTGPRDRFVCTMTQTMWLDPRKYLLEAAFQPNSISRFKNKFSCKFPISQPNQLHRIIFQWWKIGEKCQRPTMHNWGQAIEWWHHFLSRAPVSARHWHSAIVDNRNTNMEH